MIIAIPSKGRPAEVKSQRILPSAFVFVPEPEIKGYAASGVSNLVAVPVEIRGITRTRNWVLDWALTQEGGDRVVMVDDDMKTQGWVELRHDHAKQRTLTEAQWLREWQSLFDLTEDMGYRIWGVRTENSSRGVYPWKPFLEYSYVTASCMGLLNPAEGAVRFDESFPVKEDYEINLRCIVEDGGIIAARYLQWSNYHWSDPGGCSGYRTQAVELDCIKRLQEKYPGMIRQITRGGSGFSIELDFPTA